MTGVCSRPRYEFQLMNALILPLWQRTTSQTASPNRDCPVVALSDRKTVRVSSSGFFCVETCHPPDPLTFDTEEPARSEEHTSELQSRPHLVCRLLLEKKKNYTQLSTARHANARTSIRTRSAHV